MLSEERRIESAALSGRAAGRLANPDVRDEFGLETMDMNMGPHRLHEQHGDGVRLLPGGRETPGRGDTIEGGRHTRFDERAQPHYEPCPLHRLPYVGTWGFYPDPI